MCIGRGNGGGFRDRQVVNVGTCLGVVWACYINEIIETKKKKVLFREVVIVRMIARNECTGLCP